VQSRTVPVRLYLLPACAKVLRVCVCGVVSEIDGALERASFTYHAALKAMHHPSYTSEQVLQRVRSGRVLTWMREEIGKRAERAVQHALAKNEGVHLLRRNAGLRLVRFTPIAWKVIKTTGPTSTASPVRPGSSSRPLAGATKRCSHRMSGSIK